MGEESEYKGNGTNENIHRRKSLLNAPEAEKAQSVIAAAEVVKRGGTPEPLRQPTEEPTLRRWFTKG